MLEHAIQGLFQVFFPGHLVVLAIGVVMGIIFGALPGLTATMGLALLVPFTFTMSPAAGLIMLAGIYVGAMYGDAIPAILINTPGTPAAIATTFDGFPLSQKGMAQHGLVAAAVASAFGSMMANLVLILAAPPLAIVSLKFGPPEYFWLGIFGLTIISTLSTGSIIKGFLAGTVGMLLSAIGMAEIGGDIRLTFGFPELQGGIELIVALIGFFCLPEILNSVIGKRRAAYTEKPVKPKLGIIWEVIKSLARKPGLMLRSAGIGTIVGFAPGAGGNIASMVSYNEAIRWDRNPEEYGKGTIKGVAASEAANSAMAPGSLIPLLTLGIPGSPPAAVILGALMLHGMRPGAELFSSYADVTFAFMMGLLVAAFMVTIIGALGSVIFSRIINIPSRYLAPAIIFMTVLGSYSIRNNMLDVWIMLTFGIIGYISAKLEFHPAPIVLGLILGPFVEEGLVQSMLAGQAAGGTFSYLVFRPISAVLIGLCLLSLLWPVYTAWRSRQKQQLVVGEPSMAQSGAKVTKNVENNQHPKWNSDYIVGLLTLGISVVVFLATRDLSRLGGVFVDYVLVASVVLSILVLIKGFRKADYVLFFESVIERHNVTIGITFLLIYIAILPIVGFLPASYTFYFCLNLYLSDNRLSSKNILTSALLTAVVVTLFYYIFHRFLEVPLPMSMWSE